MRRTMTAAALAAMTLAAMTFTAMALAPMALAAGDDSKAEALRAIDRLDQAVIDAWMKAPLTERRALFVTSRKKAFGDFEPRASNVFAPGEKLLTYVEPVGYVWKDLGGGRYAVGLAMDYIVRTKAGLLYAGQERAQAFSFESWSRNREFFIGITLALDQAPPGDYVVAYTIRDLNSDKVSSFEQPFTIKSPD